MSLIPVSRRLCEGMTYSTECPPAGASQEVNEAAPSLAAPSASGQQAGTPSWLYGGAEAVEMAKADGWVPDVGSASGQQAGTPLVYEGVFRPYRAVPGELLHGGWEGEWALDWQTSGCTLDATHWPPAGSHKAMVFGRYVSADGYAMSRDFL